jgi:GMP synthase PP-ATPase subunit
VPKAWSRFSGVIDVSSTNVTGAQRSVEFVLRHVTCCGSMTTAAAALNYRQIQVLGIRP